MSRQWFISDGSQQKGPFTESAISEMAKNGILTDATLLWSEGSPDWIPFRDSPFAPVPSQPQPPPIRHQPTSHTNQNLSATPSASTSSAEIKKTPVILTIIFTVITAGIYYPCWFLTRRNSINSLKSVEKLGSGVFVFAIVMQSISLLMALVSGGFEGASEGLNSPDLMITAKGIDALSRVIDLVVGITLLVQCFKVRRIFREHFNAHLGHNIYWSGIVLFFCQIYYLQYKVNRLEYNEAPTRGSSLS